MSIFVMRGRFLLFWIYNCKKGAKMKLKEVLEGCKINLDLESEDIEIKDIKIDIAELSKGDLFFDLKAEQNLNKIFEKGASFVVRFGRKTKIEKKVLSVKDVRSIFAIASKNFYKKACDKLKINGIARLNLFQMFYQMPERLLEKSEQ